MEPLVIGIIVVAVALLAWFLWQQQRTRDLKSTYADEYDRTVKDLGHRRGEAELVQRRSRVRQLNIRTLTATERERYVADWRQVQEQFVDDPAGAVTRGDELVDDVMRTRGYPVTDFDRQVADLSVDHPRVVENYRRARELASRHRRGAASTEDLRQAIVLYRELFDDLLEVAPVDSARSERVVARSVERDHDNEVPITSRHRAGINRETRP